MTDLNPNNDTGLGRRLVGFVIPHELLEDILVWDTARIVACCDVVHRWLQARCGQGHNQTPLTSSSSSSDFLKLCVFLKVERLKARLNEERGTRAKELQGVFM